MDLRGLAAALNNRVRTARGGKWHVSNVLWPSTTISTMIFPSSHHRS
ncbi:hypothetical protein [Bauldia litoralis]